MSRKAVFFDIDETLWTERSFIPESTKEAIRMLRSKGNLAFISSGRCRAYIQDKKLLSLGFDGILAGCGTHVELSNGEMVYYKRIGSELATHSVETVRKYGFKPILEGINYLYLDDEEFGDSPYGTMLIKELGPRRKTIKKDYGNWEFSKISCDTTDADFEGCVSELGQYYTFLRHSETVCEMVPIGHSKATGIERVCSRIRLPLSETYAIGDSVNDLDMIRFAKVGIAMGNGSDVIKEAADYITTSIEDDGVYNALKHFDLI